MRLRSCSILRTFLALLVMMGATVAGGAERPSSYDDFTAVGVVNPNATVLKLDEDTINLINCGCTDCNDCENPDPTYLYFPTAGGKWYDIDPGELIINRTTSLFLSGADSLYTRLRIEDDYLGQGGADPIFTVRAAPLINVANMRFWPDPGPVERNDYPDGPIAFHFDNEQSVDFEMLNTVMSGAKIKIEGPGSFRLQHVKATSLGSLDALVEISDTDAELTVVGGLLSGSGLYQCEDCPKVVTTCVASSTQGQGNECACGGDGCDSDELTVIADLCDGENPPAGCPYNPCECDSYFVWQKAGRVEMYGTALIGTLGDADTRIESPASDAHIFAGVRSEGAKCLTHYPSMLTRVPSTTEDVDIVLMSNVGAWSAKDDPCGWSKYGQSHFIDYNGEGTVWMIGNHSTTGAGRLAVGSASNATIVASANRYAGNTDSGGTDPLDLLPITATKEITVGNMWSRGYFCDWCFNQPVEEQDLCDDLCDDYAYGDDLFVDPDASFPDYEVSIPEIPLTSVPDPLTLPPVDTPMTGMVDAKAECKDNPCLDYYPGDCYWCDEENCTIGVYPWTDPKCWIQAGLYKGFDEGEPVYIAEGSYEIDRPLYWVHSDQEGQGFPLPSGSVYPGGWIVGQNNNVTITNTDAEAVWTTEGFNAGVIQGITFETDSYTGSEMHSTVDLENNIWYCEEDPDIRCGGQKPTVCNECIDNHCASEPSKYCDEPEDCDDICLQEQVGRHTSHVGFYDCGFKGGRHALGICMQSQTMCDTVMTINGTFSDARVGFADGGANALQNIAYNSVFTDNEFAMGHDQAFDDASYGNWLALLGTISSDVTGARDIDPVGGERMFFFHGIESDNPVVLVEDQDANKDWVIMFDQCVLNEDNPYDELDPMIDYRQSIGPMFVHSDLGEGWIKLYDHGAGGGTKARGAFKFHSTAVRWGETNEDWLPDEYPDDNDSDQTSKLFEFELCEELSLCDPCLPSTWGCSSEDIGDSQCLDQYQDPPNWTWLGTGCSETLWMKTCPCQMLCAGKEETLHCGDPD